MKDVTWEQFRKDCARLAGKFVGKNKHRFTGVWGVPRGGGYVALEMAYRMRLPVHDSPGRSTLIVDDIVDSGRTIEPFLKKYVTAALYSKPHASARAHYHVHETTDWIHFPWERKGETVEDNVTRTLSAIGEDPNREGLAETAQMYKEIFRGYGDAAPRLTAFPNGKDGVSYDSMISDRGRFYSFCEHHMLPFFGDYYFAYIPAPTGKLIGLSKVARLVEWRAAKLQIQERLVKEIVDDLEDSIQPLGIALVLRGRHLCKELRGIKNQGEMVTSDLRGRFRENPATRAEFLALLDWKK
jgi:GTP cyclohydrolase I